MPAFSPLCEAARALLASIMRATGRPLVTVVTVVTVVTLVAVTLAVPGDAAAQQAPQTDTVVPPFARARRLSAQDVAKKKEGTFVTGLPDLSSDPVAGQGLGVRGAVFFNGDRSDPLFAYTPYRARLSVAAFATTAEAREFAAKLDVPFALGLPWRLKVDLKIGDNPANLYFGSTEATLGPLTLPSGGATFSTYKAFDVARKTLRSGGPTEAARVTDALSNRFGEQELMLNIKADYALGGGRWRVLGGYEIQRLQYRTFAGRSADAVDPVSGADSKAPNGIALLERDATLGLVSGLGGGRVSILQQALLYDTRDFEPDPTKGVYFEVGNELSAPAIGSQFTFDKLFIQAKAFRRLPVGPRTVLAGRVGVGNIFGGNAPFFEFQDQWSPDGSVNALGGARSLRGYRANRFLARSLWFANAELRTRLGEAKIKGQRFALSVAPFVDVGTVRDRWQELNFSRLRWSQGIGARLAWNQSTIISLDVGRSPEDRLVYFGIGQAF